MAIYHLTAKTVSRGESASAAARSDYIERAGRYHSDEVEVLHKGHGNMPAWAEDCPGTYWQAADLYERANGRLFKQLEFALPRIGDSHQNRLFLWFLGREVFITHAVKKKKMSQKERTPSKMKSPF